MSDELLSEIVAAEREIRRGLLALEEECAARLDRAKSETETELRSGADRLEAELAAALEETTRGALSEAQAVVAEADAYARRLASLPAERLEELILRQLQRIGEG